MAPISRTSSTRSTRASSGYTSPPPMRYAGSARGQRITKKAPKPKQKALTIVGNAPLNALDTNSTASPPQSPMLPWLNSPLKTLFTASYSGNDFPATRLTSPSAENPDLSQYISLRTSTPAPDPGLGLHLLCVILCQSICSRSAEERRLLEPHERQGYGTV